MPNCCAAFGCTNSSVKESCRKRGISFHRFPLTDKSVLRRWIVSIRRANFQPTPYSSICSDHFSDEDFEYQRFTNRRGLKKGSIPTKFSFNSSKTGNRKKQGISRKNKFGRKCIRESESENGNHKIYEEGHASEPATFGNDTKSNEGHMENPTLVEIFMNEKFYPPEQLESLANGLPKSSKLKQKSRLGLEESITALKESLHAKILLRSLKKQLLDAEIKAANAKRDYYEARKAMLSKIQAAADSEDSSDSESGCPLHNIKARLEEEESAAQVEEKMLQQQLEEVQFSAAYYKKEYYEAKSNNLSSS